MIDYTLVRSKRKTTAIYIRGGGAEVRAPLNAPRRAIDEFVAANEHRIADRLSELNRLAELRASFAPQYGGTLMYRGAELPIAAGERTEFECGTFYIRRDLPPERFKAECVQLYRQLAKLELTARTLELAEHMGVKPPSAIKINGAKTRWGSCSARGNINFSWRLIMAGDTEIDYVAVHELAHLVELNHSARFWTIVEAALPDWRERRLKLRELQKRLAVENWGD